MFVDDADVQKHLPIDTLKVEDIPDDLVKQKEYAERIVRGYLSGVVDSAVLALWVDPTSTPDIIREISGMFTAAQIYRLRFGQSSMTDPEYAQTKYNDAMNLLNGIISGDVDIPGIDETPALDNTMFEPNANSDDPYFIMGARF